MACSSCAARARLAEPEKYTAEQLEEAQQTLEAAEPNGPLGGRSLADLYREALTTPGDINEHCPKLKELAEQCGHVTDMGMRSNSTVALLSGQPKRMISVAAAPTEQMMVFQKTEGYTENTKFEYVRGISPYWDMTEETDLLFIDTQHNANQFYLELTKYSPKVRRYIVRHDTQIYGDHADGGGPGLRVGLLQFLREHPEWSVVYDTDLQYGLTVISRLDKDKQQLPNLGRQAFNFAKHLLTSDGTEVPDEVYNARLDKCLTCIHRINNRCGMCGCYLDVNAKTGGPGKAALQSEECPLPEPHKRWTKHVG